MNRHNDTETLTLLREIRDLVQILVLREIPIAVSSSDVDERPARKLFTWASLHGDASRRTDR
jgi:hypothetical protein